MNGGTITGIDFGNAPPPPDIEIDKTERVGSSGPFVDGPIGAHVGDVVEYQMEVTNGGQNALDVDFSDPLCDAGSLSGPSGDTNADGFLDVSETWVYTCSHTITANDPVPFVNTASVIGTDQYGNSDQDSDSVHAGMAR